MGTHLAGYIGLAVLAIVLIATHKLLRNIIYGGRRIDGIDAAYAVVVPQIGSTVGLWAFDEAYLGLTAIVMVPYYCLVMVVAWAYLLEIPYPD